MSDNLLVKSHIGHKRPSEETVPRLRSSESNKHRRKISFKIFLTFEILNFEILLEL